MSAEQEAPKPAPRQWPIVVKLKHPVEYADETVDSLTFQRGKLAFLKGVPVDGMPPIDKIVLMASRLCGKPVALLELLDSEDSGEVIELALDFFARSLEAGTKR